MRKLNFVEEGLLPLEQLMDEELVLITGGVDPRGVNNGCNCECSCENNGCNCDC